MVMVLIFHNLIEQEITLSGDTLSIENANYVDLSIYKDNSMNKI